MTTTVDVCEAGVVGTYTVPDGPGPHPAVVALTGSGGGIATWWGDLLAPHGIAVLAAAYFGVEPLPMELCELPVESVVAAGEWLRGRPEVRPGRVGLVGASKGAELGLFVASAYPELFGPVAAISPSCVTWFGVDLTGTVADASARSSWTHGGEPVPFVPPVPGIGFTQTARGRQSVGIYTAALEQTDAVAAAAIPVERAHGPLLLLSGGEDGMCPSTVMAQMMVDRMAAHGRHADVTHLDFPDCGHVIVRPWPKGPAPPMPFDNGGTEDALDAAHDVAFPAVVAHLSAQARAVTHAVGMAQTAVDVRGRDVVVEVHGDGGAPIVLLPGGAVATRWYFPGLVEHASATNTVVVHDRLGTGASPATPGGVSLRSWTEDTITVLDALGIERAVLVSHSLGAALAAMVLVEHPDRVTAALLLDPTPINDADLCRAIAKRSAMVARLARPAIVQRALTTLMRPRRMSASARDAFDRTMTGSWLDDTAAAARSLGDDHVGFAGRRPPRPVPTVVVTADRKPGAKLRRAHEALADQLGAELELWPRTSHSMYLERPDLVAERLDRLLDSSFSPD